MYNLSIIILSILLVISGSICVNDSKNQPVATRSNTVTYISITEIIVGLLVVLFILLKTRIFGHRRY
jgi:hypothetical protein